MVNARIAVLQALRLAPSYASQIQRRIRSSTGGAVRLALGSLHPALRKLERERLVRSWTVVPGRRRGGRARRYYELTLRGVQSAETARDALAGLLEIEPRRRQDSALEMQRSLRRLQLAAELSETAIGLSVAARKPRSVA
jgi:DNA-binding PadR family transcriptional regulator